jgi:hypothetical protein
MKNIQKPEGLRFYTQRIIIKIIKMEKTKFDLSFDNLYQTTENYQFEKLTDDIEELVRSRN